ncbi:putative fatty acid methyltransferase [Smittium culicis]|uniref:sphingolipid C(9)-methyltransferase n=1 Tax=Smittium culicis TaxID=133412 RepID=A0A1R1YAB4_9FUNG|nr:putative fatty acid methyltransferase [Smittium culicis]
MTGLLGSPKKILSPSYYAPSLPIECAGASQYSSKLLIAAVLSVPYAFKLLLGLSWTTFIVLTAVTALPIAGLTLVYGSWFAPYPSDQRFGLPGKPMDSYFEIVDSELKTQLKGSKKIPMELFFESYFDGKINLKGDCLEMFENRYDWASFGLTYSQVKFFLFQFIPELIWHTRSQDETQVRDHYDRGDDFYNAFLGETMIYTTGIVKDTSKKESLEEMQTNKMRDVCERLQLKEGDRHIDIGCGWGTFVNFAAKNYKSNSVGLTLGINQAEYGNKKAKELGTSENAKILCMDYRDAPRRPRYNKISCLEMAEHVGIRKFNEFLLQIKDMLEDDGLFYLQIAGLRSAWQYEDFVWGLFMAKYVFPGADASCPLNWVVNQLESAGFEVRSVDTVGIHYSATIGRWYENWMLNKEKIIASYGKRWFRVWEIFLSWSTIIARQGSSTCFQILAHKNLNSFDRTSIIRPPFGSS